MRVYYFRYKGMWLGGNIVIISHTLNQAQKDAEAYVGEPCTYAKDFLIEDGAIVYNDNGDY